MDSVRTNPLAATALALPAPAVRAGSVALRLAGAVLLAAVAVDQSYHPTQWFTVLVAGVVLLTVVPLSGSRGDLLAAFGAGAMFFSGTVLTHLAIGVVLLVLGALAGLAAFACAHRGGRDITLPAIAFLAAAAVTAAMQVGIVFSFE